VKQAVEDRPSEDLVTGKHFRPACDSFVRRQRDRASPVTIVHHTKQQVRLLTIKRLVTELI
jgi:hypothetical protein